MRNCSNYRPLAIDSNDMARRMLGGAREVAVINDPSLRPLCRSAAVITMASVKSISAIRDAADH